MLIRSYEKHFPFFIAVWVYMLRTLALTPNAYRFIDITEMLFPILLIPMCAFVLYDRTEIELALVSGTKTTKLFFTKIIPIITYTLIPSIFFGLLFHSESHSHIDPGMVTKKIIPEYVPDNYKLLILVSMVITVTFFIALYSLIRVLTRNCYVPILICFGISVGLKSFSAAIVAMRIPLTNCFFDPFINSYFIGNSVPNIYAEKFSELVSLTSAWTYNRLLFIGISALLFLITYLILRREKLHCGIGE